MTKRVIEVSGRYNADSIKPVTFTTDDTKVEGGSLTPIEIIPASEVDNYKKIAGEPTTIYIDTSGKIIGDENTLVKVYNADILNNILLLDKFLTKEGFSIDSTDNNNHFNPSTVSASVGIIGDAASFNGTTEYVGIPLSFDSQWNGNSFTILLAARVSGVGVWTDSSERRIMSIQLDATNIIYMRKNPVNNQLDFRITSGGTGSIYSKSGVSTTDWFFLALTSNGVTGTAYYNAVQQGTSWNVGTWATGAILNRVVGAANTGPAAVWDGDIDLVRVYNRALTPAEIAEHYNAGTGLAYSAMTDAQKSGCILAYDFDKIVTPRTSEPTGIIDLTDPDGKLSISSEKFYWQQYSTSRSYFVTQDMYTREIGRALIFKNITLTGGSQWVCGFDNIGVGTPGSGEVQFRCQGAIAPIRFITNSTGNINLADTYPPLDTPIDLAIILLSSGAIGIWKTSTDWDVFWVSHLGANSPLYVYWSNFTTTAADSDGNMDDVLLVDLPAPFNSDYGIATDRIAGAVPLLSTFTHEADCIIEYDYDTTPSASEIRVAFRIQDTDNYLYILHASDNAIRLRERIGGVDQPNLGTTYVANGRIVIVAQGTTINVYGGNALLFTGTSTSAFISKTDGKLLQLGTGGAISDIITWPRTLSGLAKTILDAV